MDLCCDLVRINNHERVRYFPRQLLTADDMRAEQEYLREKQRRHNRFLHGWGVVCGLEVVKPGEKDPKWQVTVCPGYVLTPQGDEILVTDKIKFDVQTKLQSPEPCAVRWSCPPEEQPPPDTKQKTLYLAIRYIECNSRPVRVHPTGCGCDEAACEYSRVRDSFELKALWKLPDSHVKESRKPGHIVPCPPWTDDPWVVLATITLPKDESTAVTDISYKDRRHLSTPSIAESGFVVEDILFEPGGATPESHEFLDRLVAFMNENNDTKVSLSGYTDNDGTVTANLELSERRWMAVEKYLVAKGIDSSRISGQAFGESNPIADNNTDEGRARNNRVEIKVN
jgi:outer membrane protein OmpA-like peptidoglycan-associated protein